MDQDKAFNILGIPVTSSESEIKKAYRKASLKTHPDRVPGDPTAIRRFQDLSDAYEIALKSLQNKSSNMFPGGRETVDVENIFRAFTTGDNIHEIFAKMSGNLHKPVPIIKNVSISLSQAYMGCMIPVSIERVVHNGGVATKEEEMMYVDIPPGTDAREMIVYRGKGNINPNGDQGDIKIFVTIEEHPTFERRGLDLIYRHKISLREALCGFSFDLEHLNRKSYKINNARGSVIGVGFAKTVSNLGMRREDRIGSLIVEFDVSMPTKLSEDQVCLIEKALPANLEA